MTHDARLIDQKQTTQRDASGKQHIERTGDLFVQVRDERVLDISQTTLRSRNVAPRQVRIVAVDGDAEKLNAEGFKLLRAIREGDDFGRADEREIERIEKE